MFPASSVSGREIRNRCAITVAVVLLPLVPVTPITCLPPRSASHSAVAVVTVLPFLSASWISGL